ncbi:hypothetical protein D9M71_440220 [compost metagenome]
MGAHHETANRQQAGDGDRHGGPTAFGEAVEQVPEATQALAVQFLVFFAQAARGRLAAHTAIGQQHRQQHQVGEDQHRHTDTGGNGQILDDRDIDQHQHRKAHGIGK